MKTSRHYRELAVKMIYILFIVLFVYTAIMKIRDYEIFYVRLGQSPMLEGMGVWLAVLIPVALLFSAALLFFDRTRLRGLYSALVLMLVFTMYIGAVLSFFSSSLPCSCNGVFEVMTWKQHLWFNLFFTALAVVGIVLYDDGDQQAAQDNLIYDIKT